MTSVEQAKSWPFQEARNLLQHIAKKGKKPGDIVTFETGYGPSGPPHIGTFGEVVRTLMVMRAFNELTEYSYRTRLIIFSDDYDGFRSVPEGVPSEWQEHLGKPLSQVPDPHHAGMSYAQVNNSKLVNFVNQILHDRDGSKINAVPDDYSSPIYMFRSSSAMYTAGDFNEMLSRVYDRYQAIMDIMLPTLGQDRRQTYSPFMFIDPDHNRYVTDCMVRRMVDVPGQVQIWHTDPVALRLTTNISGKDFKLQWKVDWAMRWVYFDVDYEMYGKDLTDSYSASRQICKVLGGTAPIGLTYELFLDADGKKISKKIGNGVTMEDWFRYGSREALALYMFQSPKSAKNLSVNVIPRVTDEYLKFAASCTPDSYDNPTWHIHSGTCPTVEPNISFNLLLNLAVVSAAENVDVLMSYLEQNRPIDPTTRPMVEALASNVISYATDNGLMGQDRRPPTAQEAAAFDDLANRFQAMVPGLDPELYQFQVYEVGKAHGFEPLRSWFQALYECILGDSSGPRFGAFTAAYGLERTVNLLREAANHPVDGLPDDNMSGPTEAVI